MSGIIASEVVDRYGTALSMISNQVVGGIPDDNVRYAGLLAEARLCEVCGDEVTVNGAGLGR
nr:hypothetical protein [Mesorhizobium sp.]